MNAGVVRTGYPKSVFASGLLNCANGGIGATILQYSNQGSNIHIMSEFMRRLRREPTEPRTYVSYDDFMKLLDKVRPITVRLPVSTVAKLDELQNQCPSVWSSRQELLFEMIESCVKDWIDAQPASKLVAKVFDDAARKALKRSTDG